MKKLIENIENKIQDYKYIKNHDVSCILEWVLDELNKIKCKHCDDWIKCGIYNKNKDCVK